MRVEHHEPDPQALARQKSDFTAEGAPFPCQQAPSAQDRADAGTPLRTKPHRDTLTLKRPSRARYP
jgi:hypothetical protein